MKIDQNQASQQDKEELLGEPLRFDRVKKFWTPNIMGIILAFTHYHRNAMPNLQ